MAREKREELDPQLPYTQVHRGVPQQASVLAPLLKVTYQHALGGLVAFWLGLADRRLLVDEAGQIKPELVLSAEDVSTRLLLAFGMEVPPRLLVATGFLEARPGGYRIRGASRMLNTEAGRLSKKVRATGERPKLDSDTTGVPPESDTGETPVGPGSDSGPTGERLEVRGERLEEKDERQEENAPPPEETDPAARPLPPAPESKFSSGDSFFDASQHERVDAGLAVEKRPKGLNTWFSQLRVELQPERIQWAFDRWREDPYWADRGYPFPAFMSQARKYADRAEATPKKAKRL